LPLICADFAAAARTHRYTGEKGIATGLRRDLFLLFISIERVVRV